MLWQITLCDTADSTQDVLRAALLQTGTAFCAVRALDQTGGRGRHGRQCHMQPGDCVFSFSLTPTRPLQEWGSLGLLAGLALYQALSGYGLDLTLKWPNDALLGGRKCAGILCEIEGEHILIGMGINLTPRPDQPTFAHLDIPLEADALMRAILQAMHGLYIQWETEGFASIAPQWLDASFAPSTLMSVKQGDKVIAGQFKGVDRQGGLLLAEENGRIKTITAGELIVSGDVKAS